jgi:hypothetical protein
MYKVQKPSNSECYTPSSEPFRINFRISRHFMEPGCSLPCSQEPAIVPHLGSHESSLYHPISFIFDPYSYYPSTYVYISLMASFLLFFPPNPICIPLLSHACCMLCLSDIRWVIYKLSRKCILWEPSCFLRTDRQAWRSYYMLFAFLVNVSETHWLCQCNDRQPFENRRRTNSLRVLLIRYSRISVTAHTLTRSYLQYRKKKSPRPKIKLNLIILLTCSNNKFM